MTFLTCGYAKLPTPGYLRNGVIRYLRFWSRALSDDEMESADILQNVMDDAEPKYVPEGGAVWYYFPLDGNLYYMSSGLTWPSMRGSISSTSGRQTNRFGLSQRALTRSGIKFNNMNEFFSYAANVDATFSMWVYFDALPTSGSSSLMYRYYPYSAKVVGLSVLPSGIIQLNNNA